MYLIKSLFFAALWVATLAKVIPSDDGIVHYNGYRVIRAIPQTQTQFEALQKLALEGKYDFWQEPRPGGVADIMVCPKQYAEVEEYLNQAGISSKIMIPDVEELIQEERLRRADPQRKLRMDWEDYHTWEEVNQWLDELVAANPDLITKEKYGVSFEFRDLYVYKVSTGAGPNGTSKPAFWIDATIHAREHITTGVITYVINQLVSNSSSYQDLLQNVDFYFAPFINPDGYVFTFTSDRLFRRTRSNWTNATCIGVDANRNFGFQFGGAGSSGSPCSETYRGPLAYSEPETRAMKDYIDSKARNDQVNWEAFITLHSYSQLWMTPYGYTETPPEDYAELKQVGDEAAAALGAHFNTPYTVGNAGAILYLSSGSSRDWAKGEGGFKWVYTIELRDTGRYGFLLPPDQILPTSIETWSGIQVVARKLIR